MGLALQGQRRHAGPGLERRRSSPSSIGRDECCHSSGSLYFGPDGTDYYYVHRRQHEPVQLGRLQPDRRALRPHLSRPGSAPRATPTTSTARSCGSSRWRRSTGTPGVGATYTINRQPVPTRPRTRPTRPRARSTAWASVTIHSRVDPETWLGAENDYKLPVLTPAPDRRQPRPAGLRRVQRAHRRFPLAVLCIRDNVRCNDYDFATSTSGAKFNCAAPGQRLAQQHGPEPTSRRPSAPPPGSATPRPDSRVPGLGTGSGPMGGPRYHYDGEPRLRTASSAGFYDETSGSSPSGITAGSRPPTSTTTRRA